MHEEIKEFVRANLSPGEIKGKLVLEAGSYNVNGTVKFLVENCDPAEYIGTDMRPGPDVDIVCKAEDLPDLFGNGYADIVICLEMMEHAEDWQGAMAGLILVMAAGGILMFSTRSPGFPLHGFPEDYWRFTPDSMDNILSSAGLDVLAIASDTGPGVLVKARKPDYWEWHDIPDQWSDCGVLAVDQTFKDPLNVQQAFRQVAATMASQ